MGKERSSSNDKGIAFEELKNNAQPLTTIVDKNKDGLILDEDDDIIEDTPTENKDAFMEELGA